LLIFRLWKVVTEYLFSPGYRSIPLLNGFSESVELGSLLVHVDIGNPAEEEQYERVANLRDQSEQLHRDIEAVRGQGQALPASVSIVRDKERQLHEIETKLLMVNEDRCRER
jgi:hypothetical protein